MGWAGIRYGMGRDGGKDVVRWDGLHKIAWDQTERAEVGLDEEWDGMEEGMR